ncbi:MAG: hypothetical protein U0797_01000 [Gemmataceae bacterium]
MPRQLQYWDCTGGRQVTLGPALGPVGSESRLYAVAAPPDCAGLIALMEKDDRDFSPELSAKLGELARRPPEPLIAAPVGVLSSDPSSITAAGFLAPRVAGKEVDEDLAADADRDKRPRSYYFELAYRLAETFGAGESAQTPYIDNHPGNFMAVHDAAGRPARVVRIDPLSLEVMTHPRLYGVAVARPEYLPPELQRAAAQGDLGSTARGLPAHRFGLAALLYEILVGVGLVDYSDTPDPLDTPERRMANKQFALVVGDRDLPPGAVVNFGARCRWAALPAVVKDLLHEALLGAAGHRPSPAEWCRALGPFRPATASPAPPPSPPSPLLEWAMERWVGLTAVALIALAAYLARPGAARTARPRGGEHLPVIGAGQDDLRVDPDAWKSLIRED